MVFYVVKDIEKAKGLDLEKFSDVVIITNRSPMADKMIEDFPERILKNNEGYLSTFDLLKKYKEIISADKDRYIIVFKNTSQIQEFCLKNNWQLLNPDYDLSYLLERKITQYDYFAGNGLPYPKTIISKFEDLSFQDIKNELSVPFIVQYNVSHTGEGTSKIESEEEYINLQTKFPKRIVKFSEYLEGDIYTINACVMPDGKVLCGKISYQITGIENLTTHEFATVGNDWQIGGILQDNIKNKIEELANRVGSLSHQAGWRGLLGIDFIVSDNRVYVIEINARQAISASFETDLAGQMGKTGPLIWHIEALLGETMGEADYDINLQQSQIFIRKKDTADKIFSNIGAVCGVYNLKEGRIISSTYKYDIEMYDNCVFVFSVGYGINQVKPADEIYRIQANFSLYKNIENIIKSITNE